MSPRPLILRSTRSRLLVSVLAGVLTLLVAFGVGLFLRPSLDSLLARRHLSVHESRRNLERWKDGRLQVLVTQWKLTGESDRTSGRDELIWLWRIVLLNASLFGNECVARVTLFSLRDPQGFDVAAAEPTPQEITVRSGATASVSGSGRLARARMSAELRPNWELQTTCPEGLPEFAEAKITEILETGPPDRNPSSGDWSDARPSRMLGPVTKVRALRWSQASYIREIRNLECQSDPPCLRRREAERRDYGAELDALFNSPVTIQIQFPRGAKLRVGDVIYTFDQRFVEDGAGVRRVGYGFTPDGASLPLRHWHDERHAAGSESDRGSEHTRSVQGGLDKARPRAEP